MDDNKFNKIMEDYVSSTSGNIDKDLKKLPSQPNAKKKYWGIIALASALSIIVLLSIILPIYFSNVDKPDDTIQYYDSENVMLKSVEDISQLESYGISNFMVSEIEVKPNIQVYFLKEKPDEIIGAKFEYNVLDYEYEEIDIKIIHKNYKLQELVIYDIATNTVDWNGITAKYFISNYDKLLQAYKMKIKFSDDGYDYFINVVAYEEIEPSAILDFIY